MNRSSQRRGWAPQSKLTQYPLDGHNVHYQTYRTRLVVAAAVVLLGVLGCQSSAERAHTDATASAPDWRYTPDVPVSHPPFTEFHANYKERLDQPYVFVECRGSYLETGRALPALHQALAGRGIRASGPPFGLFYDDPKSVPLSQLRSRACLPVDGPVAACEAYKYDVLPQGTVVYAVVSGPYPEAPRAYPGLYKFMSSMGWVEDGPIREVYLVPPSSAPSHDELLCEIQIPATNTR